jgi:adenylyltransferase/sulfurtransferase
MEKANPYERYQRQVILKEFGDAAQKKLLQSKLIVIGAGGLGCPLLQYLAAAGVGTLGIVDDDTVALNNLQRQVLFTENDIGELKAEKAASRIRELNSEIEVLPFNLRLTSKNAFNVLGQFDIVVDATDNFSSRYMINDACVLLNKPLVYGAISRYEGQVAVFNHGKNENDSTANYRDLFPELLKDDDALNCEETGVLGVLPGIVGALMANETIKIITGIGEPLINQLLTYNALNNKFYLLSLIARQETRSLIPQNEEIFAQTDYELLCRSTFRKFEIDIDKFNVLLKSGNLAVIDVRELHEIPAVNEFATEKIPLSQLKENLRGIKDNTIVFFCQNGKRSLQAAQWSFEHFGDSRNIYSLQGGILQWKKMQAKLPA